MVAWIWVVWGLHQAAKRKGSSRVGLWGHLDKGLKKPPIGLL